VVAFLAYIPPLPFIHLDCSGPDHCPFESKKNPAMFHSDASNARKSLYHTHTQTHIKLTVPN
jgi:hypothetical protein